MKMVLVGTAYPLRGGIAQFNASLVRSLRERGHEVTVFTFRRQYPGWLFPGRTQREEGPPGAGLDVGAVALVDTLAPWTWWRTYRRIRRLRPEAVVYKYWMPFFAPCFGTLSRWIRRGTRARVIYVCDNIVPHERRPLDGLLTRYLVDSGDAFIVMTRAVERDLRRFRPEAPAILVPHPVYEHFGDPIAQDAARRELERRGVLAGFGPRPLLLFFGIIRPYKGLDILLRAMPEIVRETGARLIVAGEFYAGRQETLRLIESLGLALDVLVVDRYLPTEDVALYVSAADVVALPYRSATQSGIVQVAFQLDCPVIATDVGGLGEMIRDGETGLLVPPEDPAALAQAVIRYLKEGLRARMQAQVRREKGRFGWDRMAEALEVLARGGPARAASAGAGSLGSGGAAARGGAHDPARRR